ncbi:MAG: lasso peptide biosynthesis B2 protein [Caulobacteraceae bacterium]|nr:lasso peptide biosynthesis B2 protein [Caulobacter sp.]
MPLVHHPLRGARVHDDLVLLDLVKGAYDVAPGVFANGASLHEVEEGLGDALGPARLVFAESPLGDGTGQSRPLLQRLAAEPAAATGRDRRDFAAAWCGLAATYPGRPLRRLLGSAPDVTAAGMERETLRRAAVFARLLPWAPFPGVCLWRAYLLRLFLRRGGCDADWMFGVRTWPFRAHCWLQLGEVVLDDEPRAVRPYTPILKA